MTDRCTLIAQLIAEHWHFDRDALLGDIISRWPDLTGEELQAAIDVAGERREGGRLARALEPGPKCLLTGSFN